MAGAVPVRAATRPPRQRASRPRRAAWRCAALLVTSAARWRSPRPPRTRCTGADASGGLTVLERVDARAVRPRCSPGSRSPSVSAICGFVVAARAAAARRHRRRQAAAAARTPHRAADADLQRGPAASWRALRGDPRVDSRARGAARPLRLLRAQRHHRPRRLDRRGGGLPARCASASADRVYLPPPAREHRAQGRQHRRLGAPLRRRLRHMLDPRRRQPDGRRHASCALAARDGAHARRRADPDPAGHRRRPHACSRRMQQFAGRLYGPVDRRAASPGGTARRAITGATTPSSAPAPSPRHAGLPELPGRKPFGGHILSHDFVEAALLRRAGWAVHMAAGARAAATRKARPRSTDFAVARPPLVPGQSAARRRAAGARPALDQPPASAHGHRLLHHRAALARCSC